MGESQGQGALPLPAGIPERKTPGKIGVRATTPEASIGLLHSVDSSIDDLRALISCRVCVRPFQWFANSTKKTCPDCRTMVTQQPAPAYLVREMTQLFVNRAELIPEGETTEDHRKWQQEEADVIERDKSNTDHDADGVTRCPVCAWEIEDGVCQRCSLAFGSDGEVYSVEEFSDSEGPSFDSDGESITSTADTAWHAEHEAALAANYDDDGDISLDGNGQSVHTYGDMADGDFAFGHAAAQGLLGRPIRRPSQSNAPADRRRNYAPSMLSDVAMTHTDSAAEESDSEDEPGSLNGFVVEDEVQDGEPPSTLPVDGDPHEGPDFAFWELGEDPYSEHPNFAEMEDDDSDEGGAISNRRRRRRMRSSSSIPEDDTERYGGAGAGADSSDSDEEQGISRVILREGWSPLHQDPAGLPTHAGSRVSPDGRSSAHPVDLQSDSDTSALPQRLRRRLPQLSELSYGDDSEHDDRVNQTLGRRRQSSSGTVTVGRGSPAPESSSSSSPQLSRRAQQSGAPILITSSPARPQSVGSEREVHFGTGRRARSQSNETPVQYTQRKHVSGPRYSEDQQLFGGALVRALGRSVGRSVSPEDTRREPLPEVYSPSQEPFRATRPNVARIRARQRSETSFDRAGLSRRHSENTGPEYQSQRRRYKERRRQQRERATSISNQGHQSSWDDPVEAIIEEELDDFDNYANHPPRSVSGHDWED
ncbi:hypothetical protein LPUS_06635 [Lasallia pustulata]|uniref:Uncharacterized protein n=1 Tax=Lasallia pustulata TaxID=136370 RepID=A0A1W5D1A0_9LECA|nr:hypothetical protein LPUS_06635 [Lasallia pustulata]